MRNVQLRVRTAREAGAVFEKVSDFASYPEHVKVIRDVTVHPAAPGSDVASDWEVYFRNGILRWSEVDTVDRAARTIDFVQTEGDFDEFSGRWSVTETAGSSEVLFEADFDFGIPSLAGILDPIAERTFKETIGRVLVGLFGDVTVIGDEATAAILDLPEEPVELAAAGAL